MNATGTIVTAVIKALVIKHPGHDDQSVHGRRGGEKQDASSGQTSGVRTPVTTEQIGIDAASGSALAEQASNTAHFVSGKMNPISDPIAYKAWKQKFEQAVAEAPRFYRGIDSKFAEKLLKTDKVPGDSKGVVSWTLDPGHTTLFGNMMLVGNGDAVRQSDGKARSYDKWPMGREELEVYSKQMPTSGLHSIVAFNDLRDHPLDENLVGRLRDKGYDVQVMSVKDLYK